MGDKPKLFTLDIFTYFRTLACYIGWLRPPAKQSEDAKEKKEKGCALFLTTKYEPDMVKNDRGIEVGSWHFSIFLRKVPSLWRHPVGGGWVVSTSGYLFPVGCDLNRSKCCGDLIGSAYFRFGKAFENRPNANFHVFPMVATRLRLALELGYSDFFHLLHLGRGIPK